MSTSVTSREPYIAWQGDIEGPVKIGSEEHKQLFCRMFLDTFDPYKPAVIDWPKLDDDALLRLTSLPFWHLAVTTEGIAAANMNAVAEDSEDPLIREAIALNAFEEQRHKHVLEHMINFYGIKIDEEPPYLRPKNAEWSYLRTGYGECFDSFFAFGLFKLAKDSGFFPKELVEVFEPIIQEEARHIMYFVNWRAYMRIHKPLLPSLWFSAKSVYALMIRAHSRLKLARGSDDNSSMTIDGHKNMNIDISPRGFMETCLDENERRMAGYDKRLLRPGFVPRLVKAACPFFKKPA
ncbi:MAG: ferritin-like domain-containing protein [Rhodospirillales bacterium]|jgi:hypothetical protein